MAPRCCTHIVPSQLWKYADKLSQRRASNSESASMTKAWRWACHPASMWRAGVQVRCHSLGLHVSGGSVDSQVAQYAEGDGGLAVHQTPPLMGDNVSHDQLRLTYFPPPSHHTPCYIIPCLLARVRDSDGRANPLQWRRIKACTSRRYCLAKGWVGLPCQRFGLRIGWQAKLATHHSNK